MDEDAASAVSSSIFETGGPPEEEELPCRTVGVGITDNKDNVE
ncbi:hypothetical protein [Rhizobium sp. FY34]|nr:hypothetical protein [Rhizobium sp. FY34]